MYHYLPLAASMAEERGRRRRSPNSKLASCLIALTFLLLFLFVLSLVLFLLFRPKDPQILTIQFQIPRHVASESALEFTLSEIAQIRNPNRAAFSHYDSTFHVSSGGRVVGSTFVPAGKIGGGDEGYVAASAAVRLTGVDQGSLIVESRLVIKGKIRVLSFLDHPAVASCTCLVSVSAQNGSVLGFHC